MHDVFLVLGRLERYGRGALDWHLIWGAKYPQFNAGVHNCPGLLFCPWWISLMEHFHWNVYGSQLVVSQGDETSCTVPLLHLSITLISSSSYPVNPFRSLREMSISEMHNSGFSCKRQHLRRYFSNSKFVKFSDMGVQWMLWSSHWLTTTGQMHDFPDILYILLWTGCFINQVYLADNLLLYFFQHLSHHHQQEHTWVAHPLVQVVKIPQTSCLH